MGETELPADPAGQAFGIISRNMLKVSSLKSHPI